MFFVVSANQGHESACDADAVSPNQSQSAVDALSPRPNQPQNNKLVCLLVTVPSA